MKIELSIQDFEPTQEQLESVKGLRNSVGWNVYRLILQKRFITIFNKLRTEANSERLKGELDGLEYAIKIEEHEPQPEPYAE